MTGGYDWRGNRLGSTEIVRGDGSVVQGPPLPSARAAHCMVDLLDERIMLIGGSPTLDEVLIYHPSSRSFLRGPSLKRVRYGHACVLFTSSMHQKRPFVLVAGGYSSGESRSVEILDFTNPSAVWTESEY